MIAFLLVLCAIMSSTDDAATSATLCWILATVGLASPERHFWHGDKSDTM